MEAVDLVPSGLANGINEGVQRWLKIDLDPGTKSKADKFYFQKDYEDDVEYNSYITVKDIEADLFFERSQLNQTFGAFLHVSEKLDKVHVEETVRFNGTVVADCVVKLKVADIINVKVPGTLTFSGLVVGTVKVQFTKMQLHKHNAAEWRFEAATASTADFNIRDLELVTTELEDDCTISGYDLCEAASESLEELFTEKNSDSLNAYVEDEVLSQVNDRLGSPLFEVSKCGPAQ